MSSFVFETPRLQARHITVADADAMVSVYGDAEVVRWVADGQPLNRSGCEEWIGVTLRNYTTRGYGMLALVERASGDIVGFCGLVHPGGQPEAEIKYALRRDHWGKGLATEAARALLSYGSSHFGIAEVIATTAPENASSHSVLLKAGMQRAQLRENGDGSFTQLFVWRAPLRTATSAPSPLYRNFPLSQRD